MFKFFRKLRNQEIQEVPEAKSKSVPVGKKRYAPNTKIQYQPELIKNLKNDHVKLLDIYSKIVEAQKANKKDVLMKELLSFKTLLRGHLVKETTSLYVYLKHSTNNDQPSNKLVSEMQLEMGKIGNAVFRFISKWTDPKADHSSPEFTEGLSAIGETLIKRISAEEKDLYPIYQFRD